MKVARRLSVVRKLIAQGNIATQEDLREKLEAQGVSINQATLSRDLAKLGARRVSSPEGGTMYELPPAPTMPSLSLETLVIDITSNGNLVVVQTTPGAASAVALLIDAAKQKDVLGTIAGDDTVFVAPRQAKHADRLAQSLWRALGKEEE